MLASRPTRVILSGTARTTGADHHQTRETHMEFIIPNWHVVLVHAPLGLLAVGVLIELFSFLYRHSPARIAARWMMLFGALLSLPAMTVGTYALRQQAVTGDMWPFQPWHEIAGSSPWSDAVWELMEEHIWFSAGSSGIALLLVVLYIAGSDRLRGALYVPGLLLMALATAAMGAGAWHAGEAVYRHGVAVATHHGAATSPASTTIDTPSEGAEGHPTSEPTAAPVERDSADLPSLPDNITWYIPPLELHLLLAGLTAAAVFGAVGLSIRQWTRPREAPPATEAQGVPASSILQAMSRQPHPQVGQAEPSGSTEPAPVPAPRVFPARVWLLAILFALGTAAAGLWFTADWEFRAGFTRYIQDWNNADIGEARLFWHVAAGGLLVLTMLLLALLTRFARRSAGVTSLVILLVLALLGSQVWLGILMLFDSHSGPLIGFNS